MRLAFCCVVAPESGGETPIGDSRAILRSLPPRIVDEFRARGVESVRTLHGGRGAGSSWQDTFRARTAIGWRRRARYLLRVRMDGRRRPADREHPAGDRHRIR